MDSCVESVMKDNPGYDKSRAIAICHKQVASKERLDSENGQVTDKTIDRPFRLYKERGRLKWVGIYSNNFIDRDRPPDIISKESHRRFVRMVDKGVYDPPELWLFHLPQYKFGQAEWVAYDESGFALAGGTIDPNPAAEKLAEVLAERHDVAMSHSMPLRTIRRHDKDRRVIVEHQSIEVTALPDWAAASQLTGFHIVKEVADMAIDAEKKKALLEEWGVPANILAGVESENATRKDVADGLGLESKEADDVSEELEEKAGGDMPADDEEAEDTPDEETPEEEKKEVDEPEEAAEKAAVAELNLTALRKEIAEGIVEAVAPLQKQVVTALNELAELKLTIDKMAEDGEVREQELKETPLASVAEYIRKSSALGRPETKVDGRTALAKGGPKEVPAHKEGDTGIGWLDSMLAAAPPTEGAG